MRQVIFSVGSILPKATVEENRLEKNRTSHPSLPQVDRGLGIAIQISLRPLAYNILRPQSYSVHVLAGVNVDRSCEGNFQVGLRTD